MNGIERISIGLDNFMARKYVVPLDNNVQGMFNAARKKKKK